MPGLPSQETLDDPQLIARGRRGHCSPTLPRGTTAPIESSTSLPSRIVEDSGMSPAHRSLILIGLFAAACSLAGGPASPPEAYPPDPASVERFGPAYRYPQSGW